MHGQGTLKLKCGEFYSGNWVDGCNDTHKLKLEEKESEWKNLKAKAVENCEKLKEENKARMLDETLDHCLKTLRMLRIDKALEDGQRKYKEFPEDLKDKLAKVSVEM